MTLRHAAALALVGWYLMVPPDARPRLPANWLSHAPLHYFGLLRSGQVMPRRLVGWQDLNNTSRPEAA